jgi:hypothetical protein
MKLTGGRVLKKISQHYKEIEQAMPEIQRELSNARNGCEVVENGLLLQAQSIANAANLAVSVLQLRHKTYVDREIHLREKECGAPVPAELVNKAGYEVLSKWGRGGS